MIAVAGTYNNGFVELDKEYKTSNPVKVIVTFLEDLEPSLETKLSLADFSFKKSQENLKGFKGSLSDSIIEERGLEL